MRPTRGVTARLRYLASPSRMLALTLVLVGLAACATTAQNVALGVGAVTVLGTQSASSEIQQIYYIGIFDPQDQLPPQVYRVRVHGQASFIGLTKFASGWVPADVADSLGSSIGFDKQTGQLNVTPVSDNQLASIQTGRRLIMFGPEGFREAPAGHRLVVVMGSNPEVYFQAIDTALGDLAQANFDQQNNQLNRTLFEALVRIRAEDDRLSGLHKDIEADLPTDKAP